MKIISNIHHSGDLDVLIDTGNDVPDSMSPLVVACFLAQVISRILNVPPSSNDREGSVFSFTYKFPIDEK